MPAPGADEAVPDDVPTTQSGWYERLREWGLPVSDVYKVVGDLDEVREYIGHYAEHRHDPPYEIDGVVVKIDRLELQRAARGDQPGAALGDRLQVPAGGGHHPAAGHPGERRAGPAG